MKKILIIVFLVGYLFPINLFSGNYKYIIRHAGQYKIKATADAFKGQGTGTYYLICSDGRVFSTNFRYGYIDSTSHEIWYYDDKGHSNKVCGIRSRNN